jgi:hypothetical protein
MTSVASAASMASMTSTASFHQKIYRSWWFDHPYHPNDQYQSLFVEWIIKNPIFNWYLILFLSKDVEAIGCYFFWKLVDETQISKPPEATRHHNSLELLILLPLRADLLCILHYETPCTKNTKDLFSRLHK